MGVRVPDAETVLAETGECWKFHLMQILIIQCNIEDKSFGIKVPDAQTVVVAKNGRCSFFFRLLKYDLLKIIMKTICWRLKFRMLIPLWLKMVNFHIFFDSTISLSLLIPWHLSFQLLLLILQHAIQLRPEIWFEHCLYLLYLCLHVLPCIVQICVSFVPSVLNIILYCTQWHLGLNFNISQYL